MPQIFVHQGLSFSVYTSLQERLKERERELRKRKEREEQEMERVRLKIRRKEAIASFQALLVETIKDSQVGNYYQFPSIVLTGCIDNLHIISVEKSQLEIG